MGKDPWQPLTLIRFADRICRICVPIVEVVWMVGAFFDWQNRRVNKGGRVVLGLMMFAMVGFGIYSSLTTMWYVTKVLLAILLSAAAYGVPMAFYLWVHSKRITRITLLAA